MKKSKPRSRPETRPRRTRAPANTAAVPVDTPSTPPAAASPAVRPAFAVGDTRQAIGRLAAGIAHDFNNLLTSILGFGHILKESLKPGSDERDYASQIVTAGERAANLVRQMLAFSSQHPPRLMPADLHTLIRARDGVLRDILGSQVRLNLELTATQASVLVDAEKWHETLSCLVQNARDAMPAGGEWTIRTDHPAPDELRVEFRDNGEGMDPGLVERIFEPFYSTRDTHNRPGLGLSIVFATVENHGGRIEVRSAPGEGTSIFIILPLAHARRTEEKPAAPTPKARGEEHILVVDDEEGVLKVLRHQLTSLGYRVTTARNGGEATKILSAPGTRLDLLLTDIAMPGIKVEQLAAETRRLHPGCPVLFTSGFPQGTLRHGSFTPPAANFIQKPCSTETLAIAVRRALEERTRAALAPRVV